MGSSALITYDERDYSMPRLGFLAFVIGLLASTSAAQAQSTVPWQKIPDVGGDESTSMLDTSTVIREPGGLVLVRVALKFAKVHRPTTFAARTDFTITQYEVDCPSRRFRVGPGAEYDVKGNRISGDDDPSFTEWVSPQPLTIGNGLITGICGILRVRAND